MKTGELYVVFNATASDILSVHATREQARRAWLKRDTEVTMTVYVVMSLEEAITKMLQAESYRNYIENRYEGYGGD